MSQPFRVVAVLFGVGCMCTGSAQATYSIAAVDQSTQQVGGAVTSCVGTLDVGVVYGALPGVGVIHTQAALDRQERAKKRALELFMQGMAPSDILKQITAQSFDPQYASRQYGIVDLMGRSAGFTGAQAQDYKHDQQGKLGSFAYSVQGNILTSQKVLDQAASAFEAGGCDLAERLMRALEAGAQNGEGDVRCTRPSGIPSDSAFIEVDLPDKPGYLKISVSGTGTKSPLPQLRMLFDDWRKTHPCSAGAGSAGASAAGAGASGSAAGRSGAAAVSGSQAGTSGVSAGHSASGAGAGASGVSSGVAAAGGTSAGMAAASGGVPGASGMSGIPASSAGAIAGTAAVTPSGASAGRSAANGGSAATAQSRSNGGASGASQTQSAVTTQPASASSSQPPSASSSGCAALPTPRVNSPIPLTLLAYFTWLIRRRVPATAASGR